MEEVDIDAMTTADFLESEIAWDHVGKDAIRGYLRNKSWERTVEVPGMLGDLLADLHQLCDAIGVSWDAVLMVSEAHHQEETR
jgi:hypothetical protein